MTSSTDSDITTTATDADLIDVRVLVEDALRQYAQTPRGLHGVAGVTALDLAENVRCWTHTTRLRDFVEGVRTAAH